MTSHDICQESAESAEQPLAAICGLKNYSEIVCYYTYQKDMSLLDFHSSFEIISYWKVDTDKIILESKYRN